MLIIKIKGHHEVFVKFDINEIAWLMDRNLLKRGVTGDISEDKPETLPYYGDYELCTIDFFNMKDFCLDQINKLKTTPGFKSQTFEKFLLLINTGLDSKNSFEVFGE